MHAFLALQLTALMVSTVAPAFGADSNSSTCYFVNGDLASTHTPCFPDKVGAGDVSSCCYISNGDVCLDTGICLSAGGLTYQGACTDPNWLSNSCPHRCPDPQDKWQGGSSRPQYWNIVMCAWDIYCCREQDDTTTNCCNMTAALSSTVSAIGLPTQAVTTTVRVSLSAAVSSGNTGLPMGTAAAEATLCPGTSNTIAVGAGVGVSLGTLLIASLVTLAVLIRRQKYLRNGLALARESAATKLERSIRTPRQECLPADSVVELPHEGCLPLHRVVELDAVKG